MDVSAVFDSVDHDILLERLEGFEDSSGFSGLLCRGCSHSSGDALSLWLSEVRNLESVLYPLRSAARFGPGPAPVYVLFTAEIPQIIRSSGLSAHQYADDVQTYVHCRAAGAVYAMDRLQTVILFFFI